MSGRLHLAHQGIPRTKAQARKLMYWPEIVCEQKQMVGTCEACQKFQSKNSKELLLSHEIPELPWMKTGTDIFELEGHSYLVLVDYMSKFPEVLHLPDKTAYMAIKMKSEFARIGIPKEIMSDHVCRSPARR